MIDDNWLDKSFKATKESMKNDPFWSKGHSSVDFINQPEKDMNKENKKSKKYTIVYGEWFNRGSMRGSITKYDRIETDNLKELCNDSKYNGNLWFIFEGWCKETKDY